MENLEVSKKDNFTSGENKAINSKQSCDISKIKAINEVLKTTPVPKADFDDCTKQSLDYLGVWYAKD